jgi:hypothetical protein
MKPEEIYELQNNSYSYKNDSYVGLLFQKLLPLANQLDEAKEEEKEPLRRKLLDATTCYLWSIDPLEPSDLGDDFDFERGPV